MANDETAAKNITVHMIGQGHIDPVWLWRIDEGRKEVLDTCRSALDRMDETPEFMFTRSSAASYLWVEEDDPEMFARIGERIAEGRWEIVNGWWEQPDCNIPGGESYVRHALYAKEYFLEKFGVEPTVGYNVDTFGHHGNLPQILAKSGFDSYLFFRPSEEEFREYESETKELPQVFWWEAPDGSRVLACRPPYHYYGFGADFREMIDRIKIAKDMTVDGLPTRSASTASATTVAARRRRTSRAYRNTTSRPATRPLSSRRVTRSSRRCARTTRATPCYGTTCRFTRRVVTRSCRR